MLPLFSGLTLFLAFAVHVPESKRQRLAPGHYVLSPGGDATNEQEPDSEDSDSGGRRRGGGAAAAAAADNGDDDDDDENYYMPMLPTRSTSLAVSLVLGAIR